MHFFIKLAEFFYKFTENREFLIGRFLPYKQGIETPAVQGTGYRVHWLPSSWSSYP